MKVLIPTQVTDTHALAVMMALQQKGHDAARWFVADFPNKQTVSVELRNTKSPAITVAGVDFAESMSDVNVVWFRRPTLPIAPANIHDDDIEHSVVENSVFFHSVWSLLSDQARYRLRQTGYPFRLVYNLGGINDLIEVNVNTP